jgi:predicted amidohydrolase
MDKGRPAPVGWGIWQPEWKPATLAIAPTRRGPCFSGANESFAVGGLTQQVTNLAGGKAYAVRARCALQDVPAAFMSTVVQVRLEWFQGNRSLHPAGVLVCGPTRSGRESVFADVLVAPPNADGAQVFLEVKWPRGGRVTWIEASLQETPTPAPRKVKVGTVYLRPRDTTPERNLGLWCEQVDMAGRAGMDLLCLSEAILMVGTRASASEVAETIPGPTTHRLGEAARRNHLWLVAGLMERVGARLYNTAVLFNREGGIAGKYRKIHLPREEWRKGIRPGDEYPVFKTDFGTVGLQICYDYFFPETTAILASRGAEIVLAPTWGTTFVDQDGRAEGQSVFRVRARDNGLYLVPSVYDGDSLVIDPLGRILASSQGQTGVFWAEIDLNEREPLWWVGHWRSLSPRHRRPDTYGPLLDPPTFTE